MLQLYKNNVILKNNTYCKGLYFIDFEINVACVYNSFYFFLSLLKKKTQTRLSTLTDIFIYDTLEYKNRFSVKYSLLSIKYNYRFNVRLSIGELISLASVISLYSSACWIERECWDMFGVFFMFNPNISRILTDYGFKGHPLRKDFPITGYFEIFYNDLIKSIVFSKVVLTQDYRNFSFHYYQGLI